MMCAGRIRTRFGTGVALSGWLAGCAAAGLLTTSVAATMPAGVVVTAAVGVQDQSADAAVLLDEFVHYTNVARPDLAEAFARQILNSGISDAELATAVDGEVKMSPQRFDEAVNRALRMAALEEVAAELSRRVESGRLDLARDADRIAQAIEMLGGTLRQKRLGEARLAAAGEYAAPALLKVITDGNDERLKTAVRRVLRDIGLEAVTPLGVALPNLDPTSQRVVADLLGEIGYAHAGPYLLEAAGQSNTSQAARDAAMQAYNQVADGPAELSEAYAGLSREYFGRASFLTPYPLESVNNVWSYDTHVGLVATGVPTEIFADVMSMRTAAKALEADGSSGRALSLFVASNLRRENNLPGGASDPVYGDLPYSPDFYATVFGTQNNMEVLALALDVQDTTLIRDSIAALNKTTGGSNLVAAASGRQPLLEALNYPDRRVQYESALVLGNALPTTTFAGDERVVTTLASAVRTGGDSFAVVIAADAEDQRVAAGRLTAEGYTIVGQGSNLNELGGEIARSTAVDVVVVDHTNVAEARRIIEELRVSPRTVVAPILVMAPDYDLPPFARDYQADPRVKVVRKGLGDAAFYSALEEVLESGSGGRISETEAEIYAIDSLDTLRDIAISNSQVYRISDAQPALLDALAARTGGFRTAVAEVLAMIDSETAQRALVEAALTSSDVDEQIELLDASTQSVRRFGPKATQQQIASLLDVVASGSGDLADAAARLHGAMNLPTSNAVGLIPSP